MTEAAQTPPVGRPYVVLEQKSIAGAEEVLWRFLGVVQASTVAQAIKAQAETMGDSWEGGVLVAVPRRNWTPKTISVETKTTVSFS